MYLKLTSLFLVIALSSFSIGKVFVSESFPSGQKSAEGWMIGVKKMDYWYYFHKNGLIKSKGNYTDNLKNGYWFYYNSNGQIDKEGHFINDISSKWWIYHKTNNIKEKCLFQKDGITRFCLVYNNDKLIKANKYRNDVFLNQWTSISSFKRDNPHFSF